MLASNRLAFKKHAGSFFHKRLYSAFNASLSISEEVQQALAERKPVVTLESTVITHGLKFPENLTFAINVENTIRQKGAVPATTAFINGVPIVGASKTQLIELAEQSQEGSTQRPVKVSRRDIPYVMSKGLNGGTTIAGTMILSHKAGISVFATGGLGGVHRGVESTMDVSADLDELGRTPVGVVCSGPKSILDIPRTIEYLETKGVHVSTKGPKGTNIPGFFTIDSGVPSPYNFETAADVAQIIYANKAFGLDSGSVFCNPVPEHCALPKEYIDSIIQKALVEAEKQGIQGKQVTPFLLTAIINATGGKSLSTNVEFLLNNASFAAEVAKELVKLESENGWTGVVNDSSFLLSNNPSQKSTNSISSNPNPNVQADCIVVGGIAIDRTCNVSTTADKVVPTSYPGKIFKTMGGVAYNVAKASTISGQKLNVKTKLVSSISSTDYNDVKDGIDSEFVSQFDGKAAFEKSGLLLSKEYSSAQYISVHDSKGELVVACADMNAIENMDSKAIYEQIKGANPKCVLFDGNIGKEQQLATIRAAHECQALVGFEPTSVAKCSKIASYRFDDITRVLKSVVPNNSVDFATPNIYELTALHERLLENEYFDTSDWFKVIDAFSLGSVFRSRMERFAKQVPDLAGLILTEGLFQKAIQTLPYIPILLVKLGSKGVILFEILSGQESINKQRMDSKDILRQQLDKGIVEEYFLSPGNPDIALLVQYFPAVKTSSDTILSVTGAGDTFCGVVISETAKQPNWFFNARERVAVLERAQKAASLTLQSRNSVSEKILNL